MCGIAGFSGDFEPELLEHMAEALRHRGPDDGGTWHAGERRVGLAHRRLSIIDLTPTGHQPMVSETGDAVLSYNGEIYNFRELREELAGQGFRFTGRSDSEVLLQLYRRDGEACLPRLNGIFAFGLWDARERSLLLARDPLGVKPLYYAETARGLLFASELKALLQSPAVSRELDPRAVDAHLHYLWCPSPWTMLRDVRKLEPGCALRVRDGKPIRHWRFYDLPYDRPIEPMDAEEAVERVRAALAEAVRRQMVADVPVGAFLSGGLDSSAVASYAREASGGQPLRCFTIGFTDEVARREGMAADLPYARRVAEHLGVELETIWAGPEMVRELPRMLFHLDEPQNDPAPINALWICRLAREHGAKVLLSGAGGDDIFTGYRRHTALLQERRWAWLPPAARRALRAMAERLPIGDERMRRLAKAFRYADLEGDERLVSYFYWVPPGVLESVYSRELRRELAGRRAAEPLLEALAGLPRDTHALNRMLYLEGRYFLADHNLNYTDKMGMASGVEVRVPLLDPDLVTLAASLPVSLKQRGTTGKWVFRKALEGRLPPDVLHRSKAGFGAPLRHWLRGPLRPWVDELLGEEGLRRRGLFDPEGVRRLVERDRAAKVDGAYALFGLICIELWCRMFVDPPRPELDAGLGETVAA